MVICDKQGTPAVLQWGAGKYYEPITPTGFMNWIMDNHRLKPFVKGRPRTSLRLGLW